MRRNVNPRAVEAWRGAAVPAALVLSAALAAADPPAPWLVPDADYRVVCRVPENATGNALIGIPRLKADEPAGRLFAFSADGLRIPCYLVHAGSGDLTAIVRLGSAAPGTDLTVYWAAGTNGAVESLPPPEERLPVSLEIRRIGGHAVPTSWERMRYMVSEADPRSEKAHFASLDEVNARGLRDRDRIAILRSHLLCREDGVYRFAVDCQDAGFVLLDGELVAEWPGEHDAGQWREGPPRLLRAGIHRIEVYNCSIRNRYVIRLGWRRPGGDGIAPLAGGDLLSGNRLDEMRVERIERTLHPAFAWTPGPAYAWGGRSAVFCPVSFRNRTANWLPSRVRYTWDFGDGSRGEGETVSHTYSEAGTYAVVLSAFDSLGFRQACTQTVVCAGFDATPYPLQCDVVSLAAVAYGSDRAEPRLRIRGRLPEGTLAVESVVEPRSGATRRVQRVFSSPVVDTNLTLAAGSADSLKRVRWSVTHGNGVVDSGVIEFLSAPFEALPAAVRSDRLYADDGRQLVLVSPAYAVEKERAPLGQKPSRWVCVDDTLALGEGAGGQSGERFDRVAAQLAGPACGASLRYARLPEWSRCPEAYGPLLKLVAVPAAIESRDESVILSVGLPDILSAVPPAAFERQIAALTDLLTLSLKRKVIWVTPPPYPSQTDSIRPYAAAVRTVAEARGIPVADLYTAFLCTADKQRPLFTAGGVVPSARGQVLAGSLIADALRIESGESEPCRSVRWNLVFSSLR
jgi:hypothetical protein